MSYRNIPLIAIILVPLFATVGGAAIPSRPIGWVSDFAGLLSDEIEAEISNRGAEVKSSTGAENAVVTVKSLEGMTIEGYAVRIFAQWGSGESGKDNGGLLLIATNDRKERIEVSYGLEQIITDGMAGEITRGDIIPAFRAGNYPQGVLKGTKQIASLILEGELSFAHTPSREQLPWLIKVFVLFILALLVSIGFLMIGSALRLKVRRRGYYIFWGACSGSLPMVIGSLLASLFGLPLLLLPFLALGMLFVGIRFGDNIKVRATPLATQSLLVGAAVAVASPLPRAFVA